MTGVPYSRAEIAVHFPVPFCPALSRILGSKCVPSESLYLRMLAVISIRKESNSVLFQLSKAWVGWASLKNIVTRIVYEHDPKQKMLMLTSDSSPLPSRRDPCPEHPSSGDRPRRSAACRRTQCRYGPFSQSVLHPHLRPAQAGRCDYCQMTNEIRWDDIRKRDVHNTGLTALTQSQHGSPVPTFAAMLWKMSLMCGLKNKQTKTNVENEWILRKC